MFARFAVALLALSTARAQSFCNSDFFGEETYYPRPLRDVLMPPGIKDWTVTITPEIVVAVCGASDKEAGLLVTACDDAPPTVSLKSLTFGTVTRNGNYMLATGVIKTTLYCKGSSQGQGSANNVLGPVVRAEPVLSVIGKPVYK